MYVSVTMTERAYTYFVLNNGKFVFGADTAYVHVCVIVLAVHYDVMDTTDLAWILVRYKYMGNILHVLRKRKRSSTEVLVGPDNYMYLHELSTK